MARQMKILVVGGGGREHALCWKFGESELVEELYCAPGNAGISADAMCAAIGDRRIDTLVQFAEDNEIDFVIVVSEASLALGLVDMLDRAGIPAFGVHRAVAPLSGSRTFARNLCREAGIPVPAFGSFDDAKAALDFAGTIGWPVVIKPDAASAGPSIVARDASQAEAAIATLLQAGAPILVERPLEGVRASFFVLCDGISLLPMTSALRIDGLDASSGAADDSSFRGMGAISPAPAWTPELEAAVIETIVKPVTAALTQRETPFKGVLGVDIVLTGEGPMLDEFSVSFGDPAFQTMVHRLECDILPALIATFDGMLDQLDTGPYRWSSETAVAVVVGTQAGPHSPQAISRAAIHAAEEAEDSVLVFHNSTAVEDGELLSTGPRVLTVTATGADLAQARAHAYAAVDEIAMSGARCRRDIGVTGPRVIEEPAASS